MNKGYKPLLIIGLLAGCSVLPAVAQDSLGTEKIKILQNQPFHKGTRQSEIRLTGDGQAGSNVLNAEILLFRINDQVIDDNYPRLNVFTRMGFTASAGIQYTHCSAFQKDSGLIWYAGVSSAAHLGAEAAPNLVKLAFRGNKQFAGEDIEFGNSAFQYVAYDRLSFGLNGFYDDIEWKAGISLIGGRDFYQGEIPSGLMHTSAEGDSITGSLNADWHYTSNGSSYYNGYGAGLDFTISGEFGAGLFARLTVSDLGMVFWKDVQHRQVDSDVNYEGYYYTFNRDKRTGINLIDSLSDDYMTADSGNRAYALPMRIRVELNNRILPNHYLGLRVDYTKLAGYTPVVAVSHHWFMPGGKIALESSIGYGGFGTVQWMERLSLQLGDKFGLRVGIMGLEGLIMSDIPLNGGAFFEAAYFL